VIDVTDCCIQKKKNNSIAAVVRKWMKQFKILPYDEDKGTGTVRHIMGRVGVHTGEIMVCLVTARDTVPHLKELVQMLKAEIPGVKSVVQNVNKRSTNVILGEKTRLIAGNPTIKDKIGPLKFNISAQSFFQVNSEQAEKLYNTALDFANLKGKETVVDLYCGTGTITLFMAQKAKRALGIEIVPSAIRDAKKNAQANHIENADFLLGDAAVEMPKLAAGGLRPDVVILDPPAFTKSREATKNAIRGYREINIRGLRLVEDGGYFASCSCSHFMTEELLAKTIAEAARTAHKRLRQVEFRTQAPDHPILWGADDSYYLKFFIFQVREER
jgi:23S rRNA (uracil1939-C5)-methyltransferase